MSKAKLYGQSLYTLAEKEGAADIILADLREIESVFREHPGYMKILDSPRMGREDLMNILNEDFFGKVHRYTLSFLKFLSERRMTRHISECLEEYERLYNESRNIFVVEVTTAKPLSDELAKKLVARLESKTGGSVILKKHIDESCIGGIIIDTGGKTIDSSLKSELAGLKQAMTGGTVEVGEENAGSK